MQWARFAVESEKMSPPNATLAPHTDLSCRSSDAPGPAAGTESTTRRRGRGRLLLKHGQRAQLLDARPDLGPFRLGLRCGKAAAELLQLFTTYTPPGNLTLTFNPTHTDSRCWCAGGHCPPEKCVDRDGNPRRTTGQIRRSTMRGRVVGSFEKSFQGFILTVAGEANTSPERVRLKLRSVDRIQSRGCTA
jgi:hypothetical protein